MRDAYLVAALIVIGTLGVTWTLGRVVERRRETFYLVGNLVVRVVIGVVLVLVAAEAAAKGGLWWAVAIGVLPLALWDFVFTGAVIWAWAHEEPGGSS